MWITFHTRTYVCGKLNVFAYFLPAFSPFLGVIHRILRLLLWGCCANLGVVIHKKTGFLLFFCGFFVFFAWFSKRRENFIHIFGKTRVESLFFSTFCHFSHAFCSDFFLLYT